MSTEIETAPKASKSVVDLSRYQYTTHKGVKTPSGRTAVDNNDEVADALRGLSTEQVLDILAAAGHVAPAKWNLLHGGILRMAAGNVMRRLYKAGVELHIPAKNLKLHRPVAKAAE